MNFPEGENVGAGFLFCPEVIALDQEAGVRLGHNGRELWHDIGAEAERTGGPGGGRA